MDKRELARLMREGSKIVPQTFAGYFMYGYEGKAFSACALGACFLAQDITWQDKYLSAGRPIANTTIMAYIQNMRAAHPITGRYMLLFDIIVDLNDVRNWTREAIADWLEK